MLVLLDGGYEIGRTVIVHKDIAIPRLDPQRTSSPMELIIPVHGVAIENSSFGSPLVPLFPMAPHDILSRLTAIHKFGTLDETAIPQRRVRHTVLNDLTLKLPMHEVFG